MKTTTFENGSTLKVSETPEAAEQIVMEFPNPFLANRARELQAELTKRDPHLKIEIVIEPERQQTTLYCRDTSFDPARLTQWELTEERMRYDSFASVAADMLVKYWQRRREIHRGTQG